MTPETEARERLEELAKQYDCMAVWEPGDPPIPTPRCDASDLAAAIRTVLALLSKSQGEAGVGEDAQPTAAQVAALIHELRDKNDAGLRYKPLAADYLEALSQSNRRLREAGAKLVGAASEYLHRCQSPSLDVYGGVAAEKALEAALEDARASLSGTSPPEERRAVTSETRGRAQRLYNASLDPNAHNLHVLAFSELAPEQQEHWITAALSEKS